MNSRDGDETYTMRMMRRMSAKSRREIEELSALGFLDVVRFFVPNFNRSTALTPTLHQIKNI